GLDEKKEKKRDLNAEGKLGTFKYLRCLAAFYIRLAWEPVEVYTTLEPLLTDYRKIKRRLKENFSLTYVDQFVDDLLTKDRICGTSLWKLPSRANLEDLDMLEPRESPLGDEVDLLDEEDEKARERDGSVHSDPMTVSKPRLHFLHLPREIRDHIYNYLHRELELRTVACLGDTNVIFGLTNAPYPHVLLTHSRIHDEYKASDPFTHLSASATNIDHFSDLWKWHTDPVSTQRDTTALLHLKHIILRFTHLSSPSARSDSSPIPGMFTALSQTAPSLQSIMISEFTNLAKHSDASLPKNLNYPTLDNLPPLPSQMQSLRLTQRVDCRWFHSFCAAQPPEVVTHSLFQVRMHTYSLPRAGGLRWSVALLEGCATPPGYERLLGRVVKAYRVTVVEKRPRRVVGWREEVLEVD
ncbi:hypothetical protein N0V95_006018, partial [Ascochyta clinopodiicola]